MFRQMDAAHEPSQAEKGEGFRALHEGEPFLIPNPWDAGSAKVLAGLGFAALATTSSGFAYTLGRLDGDVSLDEVIDHTRLIEAATDLPVSVDLENGYGRAPAEAARAITAVAEAGAVGGSIEDYDGDEDLIYPIDEATERIAAAVAAASELGFAFTLTARAENHIRGNPDLDDTIARLRAYEDAGADVVYAPGIGDADDLRMICAAVSVPVNALALPNLTVRQIAEAGARRISVGGQLAWVAASALADAAERIRDEGDLSVLTARREIVDWLS